MIFNNTFTHCVQSLTVNDAGKQHFKDTGCDPQLFTGLGTPSLSAVSVPGKPPLLIRGHWNTLVTEPGSICGICFNFLCF